MGSTDQDERLMRRALELAAHAATRGNHPVGALLALGGRVLLEAENTNATDNDFTRHAELNLVVRAARRLSRSTIEGSTLYTTCEPCLMCTHAIRVMNITRIAYSVSQEVLGQFGGGNYKYVSCDEIYSRLGIPLVMIGPVLADEGLALLKREWDRQRPANPSIVQRAKNLLRRWIPA